MSGGRVPYVLREEKNHHRLIGEAYVRGSMKGQAMDANTTFHRMWIQGSGSPSPLLRAKGFPQTRI